jgi:hypothetical protein
MAVEALLVFSVIGHAYDNGTAVDTAKYANRTTLPDFTAGPCPDNPRGLAQIKDNLYRHTTGPGLAVHSGFVLITEDGAIVVANQRALEPIAGASGNRHFWPAPYLTVTKDRNGSVLPFGGHRLNIRRLHYSALCDKR